MAVTAESARDANLLGKNYLRASARDLTRIEHQPCGYGGDSREIILVWRVQRCSWLSHENAHNISRNWNEI